MFRQVTKQLIPNCRLQFERFKHAYPISVTPREVLERKRRQDLSKNWTQPFLEYEEKKRNAEGENNEQNELHMIHVVTRVKTLKGRPWWEKQICEEFGIHEKLHHAVPLKNMPSVNTKLAEIKHLIKVQPLTFPYGLPEHVSDVEHTQLKSDGSLEVKKRISASESEDGREVEQNEDINMDTVKKTQLTLETIQKHCDNIKSRYSIYTEYFRPKYIYRHNQDGKEHRYTKYPYAGKKD